MATDVYVDSVPCEWFALCTNESDYLVSHPAFPNGVACCKRCAEKMQIPDERIVATRI